MEARAVRGNLLGTLRKAAPFVVAAVLLASALMGPEVPGLGHEGKATVAILLVAVVLWVSEALPLAITALLMLVAMPLCGVCSYEDAFANSIGSTVFFLLGPFAFTVALDATSIPTRIAGAVLAWSGTSSRKMLFGLMAAVAAFSTVMSDVAACGVFISVGKRLLELNGEKAGSSSLGKALMMGIPWASYAGGCAVMTGNGCNVLAVDLFRDLFGVEVTFAQWFILGAPVAVAMLVVAWAALTTVFRTEPLKEEALELIVSEARACGPLMRAEKATLIVIGAALIGWVVSSWVPFVNTALVAVLALAALSSPGCCVLDFRTLLSRMNWGVILMIMSVMSVAHFIVVTGAGQWFVDGVVALVPVGLHTATGMLLAASVAGCLIHGVVPVGPAVAAVLAFPLGSLAGDYGISVAAMVMVVAWQASISYLLPLDCVPVLTYGYGYYTMADMVRVGWIPSVVLVALSVTLLPALCAFLGMP